MNVMKSTDKFLNQKIRLRDINGLALRNAEILRKSIADAKNSGNFFKKGSALIKDALEN